MAAGSAPRRGDRDPPRRPGRRRRPASTPCSPAPGFPLQTHLGPGPRAVPRRVRGRRAVPADPPAALTRCYERSRLGPGPRRAAPPRHRPAIRPSATCSATAEWVVDRDRLRQGDHRQRPRLHPRTAVQPAAGHHRPVLRGRPPPRLRRAAAPQRRPRDRGRRRRPRQGVPDGRPADPAHRAPAGTGPARPALRAGCAT